MNIPLLRRIQDQIQNHPETYDQTSFCSTACCIGGWALKLAGISVPENEAFSTVAAKLLDLNPNQAHNLFFGPSASVGFNEIWEDLVTPKRRSRVAVARIDHFIETEGRE